MRLVKGAFAAGAATSFTRRAEIKRNSRRLIDLMFSRQARDTGFYPSIATHDDALQRYAAERAAENGWPDDAWEIEMLLGVRDTLAAALGGERPAGAALPAVRPRLVALRDPPHRRKPGRHPRCWRAR